MLPRRRSHRRPAALDWTIVDLESCYQAPESDLCPGDCKANVDQLPDNCVTRIVKQVEDDGNVQVSPPVEQRAGAGGTLRRYPGQQHAALCRSS